MNEFGQKLERYNSLLNDKKVAENAIMEEAAYMATYYPRPELKKIVTLNSLDKLKKKLYVLWGGLILAVVFIILGVSEIFGLFLSVVFILCGMVAVILLPYYAIKATRDYKYENSKREKLRKENEENELWNKTEYIKLEQQYEEGYSDRKLEYEKIQAEAKNKLEKTISDLASYEEFVPENYIENVDDLFEIVKNGRADNLMDAINVFENDCYQEAILREQRAAARYAQSAYYEAERTRKLQEKEIERQQAAEKEAKRDARHVCTNCVYASNCRKFGTPNCPSYVPRQR